MRQVQRNKGFLLLILLLFPVFSLGSLEILRGKIKLILHETNGRFSLYMTEDVSAPNFQPLFVAEDPTTTKITVQADEKYAILGEDGDFTFKVEETGTGGKITWTSSYLKVEESLDFVTSSQSTVVDGIQISLNLTNLRDKALRSGVRFLLDTNLGEKKDHFLFPSGEKVGSEYRLESGLPDFIVSPSSKDGSTLGLLVMLSGTSTRPNAVLFANWKRITENSWEIPYKQGRDFNLMPYSFNDSALALYYERINLDPGKSKSVVLTMGSRGAQTFAGSKIGSTNALSDMLDTTRKLSLKDQLEYIKKDRETVEDLIGQINKRLSNLQAFSEEDQKILQAILSELEARKKNYQE